MSRIAWGLILAAAGPVPTCAQGIDDKYWVELGGFLPDVDSSVQVSSTNRPEIGTEIDLESDLALDERKALPQVSAGVRLSRHWSLGLEYYSLSRNGTVGIARDILFDDVTYPVGAQVSSGFKSTIYRATFGYSFVRKPNTRIGAAIGLHATDFSLSLTGDAQVGGTTATGTVRRREFLAPLPTVGLFASQRIAPNLTLSGRADYLKLKIDDYKGRLINAQAAITWRFAKNVGVGLMYRHVGYRVDVEKPDWRGRLEYEFSGPAAFIQFGFR